MKKIASILLMFHYLTVISGIGMAAEEWIPYTGGVDPYSYFPSKAYKPDAQFFRTARKLIELNPIRPLVITDKYGNKTYSTADGETLVKVDSEGNMTFSLKGLESHKRDSKGRLTQQWVRKPGSAMAVIKDEFGDILKMERYGLGGKVVAEYDAQGYCTKSYSFNKYGKQMEWVKDELTQARVKYDREGKAMYDVDAYGNVIAEYEYDEDGFLLYREDAHGNKTYYDRKGNRKKTINVDGCTIATYKYRKNKDGYFELESMSDEVTGDVVYYKEGKQIEKRNINNVVVETYKWHGTTLVFAHDLITGEIIWYKDGKRTYATYKGEISRQWFYFEGKMLGVWDEHDHIFTLYSHGEKALEFYMDERPAEEELLKVYRSYGLEI
ncbi:hypothetical protein ACFLTD_04085 [Elusimicrobiota bacterium]